MKECTMCSENFCTYVTGVDTTMPDGASVFYSSPQEDCPACDDSHWGLHWNKDLFPFLSKN